MGAGTVEDMAVMEEVGTLRTVAAATLPAEGAAVMLLTAAVMRLPRVEVVMLPTAAVTRSRRVEVVMLPVEEAAMDLRSAAAVHTAEDVPLPLEVEGTAGQPRPGEAGLCRTGVVERHSTVQLEGEETW